MNYLVKLMLLALAVAGYGTPDADQEKMWWVNAGWDERFSRRDYFVSNAQETIWRESHSTTMVVDEITLTPDKVIPNGEVEAKVNWRLRKPPDGFYGPGAVIYITVFGDWQPDRKIATLYSGGQGQPRSQTGTFRFRAPTIPGIYRLRIAIVYAFAPVRNFYGDPPQGQQDPAVGPYADYFFSVREN